MNDTLHVSYIKLIMFCTSFCLNKKLYSIRLIVHSRIIFFSKTVKFFVINIQLQFEIQLFYYTMSVI